MQFTRNPGGIAGALKKIGGLAEGSRIRDAHAEEISHMFFGDAFAGSFFNLFATHPPLAERIRALEPDFDGRFPQVDPEAIAAEAAAQPALAAQSGGTGVSPLFPTSTGEMPVPPPGLPSGRLGIHPRPWPWTAGCRAAGRPPQTEHLQHAGQMVGRCRKLLLDAAREPFTAQAVIYSLLLSRDDETIGPGKCNCSRRRSNRPLYQQMQQLAAAIADLPAAARLPLVDLAMPAFKRCSPQTVRPVSARWSNALVAADGKVDLFEYCLRTMLFGYLDVHFGLKPAPAARYRTVAAVAQPAAVVLSTLAYVGQQDPAEVERAFRCGAEKLLAQAAILPRPQCTLKALDAALAELGQAVPAVKRDVITAVAACIAADGQVTIAESELLRAIAAALACPLPPIHLATVEG